MVNLPAPFSDLPREQLLYPHPSPIEPLNRLSTELANQNIDEASRTKFWIKREDSNSGLAYGGNKVRKLEYVIPDALSKGATVLVTTGGLQSNHMRQVAAAGARYGLKTHLLPNDKVKQIAAEYKTLGNIQITHLMGADHSSYDSDQEKVLETLRAKGEVPYWIPSGASTHPLGGCGYARCAFEISEQEKEMGVFFDNAIMPCASGSTIGGIIAGFKLSSQTSDDQRQRKVIGIDAFANAPGKSESGILAIAKTAAKMIGLNESCIGEEDVTIDMRWNAGAYGFVDERTKDSMRLLASLEGILTDPVYTGKGLAGQIGKARLGELKESKNVLFIHTGGVPVLSAYPDVH